MLLHKNILNDPPDLGYGRVNETLRVFQYNAVNGTRSNKKSFVLKNNGTPIYEKGFDPEDTLKLNRTTGVFTIPNHFFSENEQLTYTPKSTFAGVGATSLQKSNGSNLATTVFVNKIDNKDLKYLKNLKYLIVDCLRLIEIVQDLKLLDLHSKVEHISEKLILQIEYLMIYQLNLLELVLLLE